MVNYDGPKSLGTVYAAGKSTYCVNINDDFSDSGLTHIRRMEHQ